MSGTDRPAEPAPDPGPDRPDGAPEAARTPQAQEPAPAETDTDPSEPDEAQVLQNINNFYGQVVVEGTVGIATAARSGRRSGKVATLEIARVERCYLPPDAHPVAAGVLRDRHLVILTGVEGTGRAAGSTMLAHQFRAADGEILRLPPTRTLEELADTGFKAGTVYVVQDWSPAGGEGASATLFDAEQLSGRLRSARSRLVITAARGSAAVRHLPQFTVPWTTVDPERLLAHCLDRLACPRLDADDLARLTDRARQLARPARIVELAEGLIDGVDAALAAVADNDAARVQAWFDGAAPTRRTLAAVATLAFFSGVGLHGFERLSDELDRLITAHLGAEAPAPSDPAEAAPFPQTRATLIAESGLGEFLAEEASDRPFGSEHRPAFRTGHQQQLFMAELFRRYGTELWDPVRAWLAGVVQRPLGPEHFAVARGLAALCRCNPAEVTVHLDGWAAGRLPQRFTAVGVLWAMAQDDLLAPLALQTAVGWARNRGQQRAMTAAVALGGVLGQRYLSEALRWLWVLSLRGDRIRPFAQRALGHLLGVEADAASGSSAVPRFLLSKVRPLLRPGADATDRRTALTTVLSVFAMPLPDSDVPVVARVVRERPVDIASIAEVWATAIHSGPHRLEAVTVLRRTLHSLEQRGGPSSAAARLGAELLPRLPPDAYQVVARALTQPRWDPEVSHSVLKAFLDSRADRPAHPSLR
ncbi:hypothetical protein [Kitasatospora arboriphila]|uniref:Uncharacterized protein n=1 Tax=Kitasatospora arboriphila TaxID=258052 RepID=A0ABP4E141_9ACTN